MKETLEKIVKTAAVLTIMTAVASGYYNDLVYRTNAYGGEYKRYEVPKCQNTQTTIEKYLP